MKERPILFFAPMVRALLAGTKTQTRRPVKPQHEPAGLYGRDPVAGCGRLFRHTEVAPPEALPWWELGGINGAPQLCPYGQPGDHLWVREAFSGRHDYDAEGWPPSAWFKLDPLWYWADGNPSQGDWTKPRPSIHMPRWASRITLEITGVRVERLHDISEADARAEGAEPNDGYAGPEKDRVAGWRKGYRILWDQINGPGSWAANPWVWVVEFRRAA